jgi:hypothetical protein
LHVFSLLFYFYIFKNPSRCGIKGINTDVYIAANHKKKLLVLSVDATCFDRVEHPEALKYVTLKTQVKMHGGTAGMLERT